MSDIHFSKQTGFIRGKVKMFYFDNNYLVMIVSDHISAFDVILPKNTLQRTGAQSDSSLHANATKDICKNWLIATPTPIVLSD